MILLLGGVIIAATLTFIGLYLAAAWLYNLLSTRYQARRKHVLHTTAADERVFPRTLPPPGDKAQREAAYDELRALPAPGKDYISDRTVRLPWTPPLADPLSPFTPGPVVWQPSRTLTEAELDELTERWLAAQGGPVKVLDDEDDLYDLCAGCRGHSHCDGTVETCCCTCTWGEDWDEEDEDEEPDPFLSETPAQVLPAWVIEALNGHDGVDACVESIVARTVTGD